MTTMFEMQAAHPADEITTVARVRVYDDAEMANVQKLGFNCVASEVLDIGAIADYVADSGHEVGAIEERSTAQKPFVRQEFSFRPPLSQNKLEALGEMLVDGVFSVEGAHEPEGIMLIDNTGSQVPDHPMDRGREVINQTASLPRANRTILNS